MVVNHRRVRSRRLFLCTFIDCLILMMMIFCFFYVFSWFILYMVFYGGIFLFTVRFLFVVGARVVMVSL